MKIGKRTAALIFTASLALSGCAAYSDAPASVSTANQAGGTLQVVAGSYPFAFVAERVGGDQVNVTNLTNPGEEPHDVELTAAQVASVGSADLVLYQAGFQPAVDAAVNQAKPQRVLDAATFLELQPLEGETALDPHTWLDPLNLVEVTRQTRDVLLAASPSDPAQIETNAADLIEELRGLDKELQADLENCRTRTFITSHAAFGYLASRYGLTQVGISGIEPDVEPTAARVAQVQQIASETGVTTIFFETIASPAVAKSIAADLGLTTDVLDPLEGITSESRGSDYLQVMVANGVALRGANQCQ